MKAPNRIIGKIFLLCSELVLSIGIIFPYNSQLLAANATFSHSIQTTVEVISDSETQVTQVHKLSWDDETRLFPASKNFLYVYAYPALTTQSLNADKNIWSIRVRSKSGTELSYTKSIQNGAIQLKIPYYQDLSYTNPLEFQVTYDSNLYINKEGGIAEVHYPGLSKDFSSQANKDANGINEETSYSLDIKIADAYGVMSFIQPQPVKQTKKGSITTYSYNSNSLIEKSIRITLGNKRLIKFKLTGNTFKTNENSPGFVQDMLLNYIDIALPTQQEGTEFANQSVFYTKIEPYPDSLRTDDDGNIIARIPISAAHDGVIDIEGYAIISTPTTKDVTQLMAKSLIAEIPSSFEKYTYAEAQYWQADAPEITAIATKNFDSHKTILGTLKKSLSTVSSTLSYSNVTSTTNLQRQGALMALTTKHGVCMEYADLLLSILRAQKIPTRTVFGDGVGPRVDRTLKGIGHQWVGVYFPQVGWVPVDPTWSDQGKEYIGPDLDHFVWYVASKSVNDPSGFNCLSWDSISPCRDALKIDTEPVNSIPDGLFTISDVRQKIELEKQNQRGSKMILQKVVSYLGTSKVGRLLLSTSGLILLTALLMYVVLVNIVAAVGKKLKKRQKPVEQTPLV